MLNGLNEKFDHIINVIKHQKLFPTFEEAKNMLEMEETRLKKPHKTHINHSDHSSSSTALVATQQDNKRMDDQQPKHTTRNSNRGRRGQRGRGRYNNNYHPRPQYANWGPPPPWWTAQYSNWQPQPQQQWPNISPAGYNNRANYVRPPNTNQQEAHFAQGNFYQPTKEFAEAFNTVTLNEPSPNWYMDSGASSHLASTSGILHSVVNLNTGNSVLVGNGNSIPITSSGKSLISSNSRPLSLNNVLVTPQIVKNLISIRRFTIDNWCSMEFDPFGFSVKDLKSQKILLRSESSGDLFPVPSLLNKSQVPSVFITETPSLWHRKLGHANDVAVRSLISSCSLKCNKQGLPFCNACQLGKHLKLPFFKSINRTSKPFALIHSDIWTSPVHSISGLKYYVIFLDDYSHYLWVYPMRNKSEVYSKFLHFSAFVTTQFKTSIKSFQCDNGGEYNNSLFHDHFGKHGITFRFSCPHTSQQNGKSERMLRTINNVVRSLLFQAQLSPTYWVEALHTTVHIINILPSSSIENNTPHFLLHGQKPTYSHLRVFGSLCFPNINNSHLSKLSPRSTPCLFLGYPIHHRGYRCLDLKTNRIIVSRHVIFDENTFPKAQKVSAPNTYNFLDITDNDAPIFKSILQNQVLENTTPSTSQPSTVPASSTEPTIPTTQVSQQPPRMRTRGQLGIVKPKKIFTLLASSVSRLPTSTQKALQDPNWNPAMVDEYDAQIKNGTWSLVPRPFGANVINSMWLHKHKHDADGVCTRHKSRLVANGKSQAAGIDYDETFSPVVKPASIRTVLNVALSRGWDLKQLDVKNTFLHGTISETIYMHQPPGFIDKQNPHHVCKLNKSLYGLKQAPRAWNARFSQFLVRLGFVVSKSDASLFVFQKGCDLVYLLLYVDDIILTGSSRNLIQKVIAKLKEEFPMTDMGKLRYFLGIKVDYNASGILLSQQHYATEIIESAGMSGCKPVSTPVDVNAKLSADTGDRVDDPTLYRKLAGALQYLTFTRPDITYAVQQVCLFMHDPRVPHLNALKRIIRYIQGTLSFGQQLYKSNIDTITAYSDADWAGCPDTRCSTSGYCVYLGDNLISWSSKRQQTVSRSSAEAEYRGVANAVSETCWIRNLLLELRLPITKATLVFCDNVSAVYLASNPVKHQRTKHVELDIHFVRDKVALGQVRVLHVPAAYQYADIFTKGLPTSLFNQFRHSLTIRSSDAQPEGG